jgi:signal transduction histidine kinase
VLNLVVNAAHAIEENKRGDGVKGRIDISTRRDGDFVELAIKDTGCGIAPENVVRIFDPFFTTKKVGKGTGQGLAIVRRVVVDRHGGSIDVESKVGEGARFIVRLPIEGATHASERLTA